VQPLGSSQHFMEPEGENIIHNSLKGHTAHKLIHNNLRNVPLTDADSCPYIVCFFIQYLRKFFRGLRNLLLPALYMN
jgi:hypothetical protein